MNKILLEPLGKEVLTFKSQKTYPFVVHTKDTNKD